MPNIGRVQKVILGILEERPHLSQTRYRVELYQAVLNEGTYGDTSWGSRDRWRSFNRSFRSLRNRGLLESYN